MASRLFVLVIGSIYAFIGAAGFVPSWVNPPPDRLEYQHIWISHGYGWLWGQIPVNVAHDVVYIIIGGCSILAAVHPTLAISYCKALFGLMVLFIFIGLCPIFDTWQLWGIMPL